MTAHTRPVTGLPRTQALFPGALLFATKGADKFSDALLRPSPAGLPAVHQAPVQLDCATYARYPAGDHTILVGRVTGVRLGEVRRWSTASGSSGACN
ncbi:flavin reductase [Streptomyces sp. NPDC048191]|uniref:flavin reductase n=1 Tax=Streptomyces sp. NPDC048191 TaxID=3155484 RepID=UPI0033CC958E